MVFWSPRVRPYALAIAVVAVAVAVLTACTAPPPTPTPVPATAETKPTPPSSGQATPAAAPSPAAASPAAASPTTSVASPVAASSPAPSPAASPPAPPSPSPIAAASPVAAASPAALAPPPPPLPPPVVGAASPAGRVTGVFTLPDTPIAQFQNARLPGSVVNDRKLLLGGIGSDVWHQPGDPPDQFWMMTDRGPNGQILVELQTRRTFPLPEFAPTILKVRTVGDRIEILDTVPIVGQSGAAVTGLSNLEGRDEAPFDFTAQTQLPFNVNGIDTEGLVRTSNGEFWVAEENGPSLVRISPAGQVLKRYVPQGLQLPDADYPVGDSLPAIYNKRKINRGFEGLALSPDEKTLYLVLQSPLANPDLVNGNLSRMTRILTFDIASEKPSAEYVYRFDAVGDFDLNANRLASEMKLSSATAVSPDALLILERTDWVAKIYRVELGKADNILGSTWDDPSTLPTLEASNDPVGIGVQVLPKALVIDLHQIEGMPDKIEGLTMLDRSTLVIANDNDFDIGTFDEDGNNVGTGVKSRVVIITLINPL